MHASVIDQPRTPLAATDPSGALWGGPAFPAGRRQMKLGLTWRTWAGTACADCMTFSIEGHSGVLGGRYWLKIVGMGPPDEGEDSEEEARWG